MVLIRDALEKDLSAITEIYNDAVLNSLAIWNEKTVDIDDRRRWLQRKQETGFPTLVAEHQSNTVGYATYGPFRPFEGYRYSAELSIYIERHARSQGIGARLLEALIERAEKQEIHVLIAGIEASNRASVALHQRFGFEKTGVLREVGYKHGQWLDLIFMQKVLNCRGFAIRSTPSHTGLVP